MKYLFLLLLILAGVADGATVKSIRFERIYDSQGAFDHVHAWAYVTDSAQDGTPYERDLTTGAQLAKLAEITNFSAFQLSKMPDRIWIVYNADGTIERIDHQITKPYDGPHVTLGANVPAQLVTGIQNLKTYVEGLLP